MKVALHKVTKHAEQHTTQRLVRPRRITRVGEPIVSRKVKVGIIMIVVGVDIVRVVGKDAV